MSRARVSAGAIAACAKLFASASAGPLNRSRNSAIFSRRTADGSAAAPISRLWSISTAASAPMTASSTPGQRRTASAPSSRVHIACFAPP